MTAIPQVFKVSHRELLYCNLPKPPLMLPVTHGEIEDFPRGCPPSTQKMLSMDFKKRRRYYRGRVSQIARNGRRLGRGMYIFIIRPKSMEDLLAAIYKLPWPEGDRVRHIIWAMYYQGLTFEESEPAVSRKTLFRYLREAERITGVIPVREHQNLSIGLSTITLTYTVLRMGRDGLFDIRPFFNGKIF